MTEPNFMCEGVDLAKQVSDLMAESAASVFNGVPMTPEREATISQFMAQFNVGFIGELDPTPNNTAYDCLLDCTQCLGKLGLSVKGERAAIILPQECPNYENQMRVTTSDEMHGRQSFEGSMEEFFALKGKIPTLSEGVEGYVDAADQLFNGDMFKAYRNISTIAKMTGQLLPEGWREFQGTTTEFKTQQQWLGDNSQATVDMFMAHLETDDREKAEANLAAIRNMPPMQG